MGNEPEELVMSSPRIGPPTSFAPSMAEENRTQEGPNAVARALSVLSTIEEAFPVVRFSLLGAFEAEHALLYAVDREKRELYVRCTSTPLRQQNAMRLPATTDNIFGYCARRGKALNIANAYDPTEWAAINVALRFDPTWDALSGFKTTQMLITPLIVEQERLMGLLVLINKRGGGRFPDSKITWLQEIAGALGGILYRQIQLSESLAAEPNARMTLELPSPSRGGFAPASDQSIQTNEIPFDVTQEVFDTPKDRSFDDSRELLLEKVAAAQSLAAVFPVMQHDLLHCLHGEQLFLYVVNRGKRELYVKYSSVPIQDPQALAVPITPENALGYCARRGSLLNIADVDDVAEWATINTRLQWDQTWNEYSGVRPKQLLSVPLLFEHKRLMGLLVIINRYQGGRFTDEEVHWGQRLAESLAQVLARQNQLATSTREFVITRDLATATDEFKIPRPGESSEQVIRVGQTSLPSRWLAKFGSLIEQQLLTSQDLETAVAEARRKSVDVETILVEEYRVPKKELGAALSNFYGCPFIEFDERTVTDRSLLKGMNFDYLKANFWLPMRREDDTIDILIDNPQDLLKLEHIRLLLPGLKFQWFVALRKDILQYLYSASGKQIELGSIQEILGELSGAEVFAQDDDDDLATSVREDDNAIVRLGNQIIVDAYARGASDIHIEPYAVRQDTVVRFRVDGVCQEYQRIPPSYRRALVSRFKIMSRLDIAERRRPQDGKIRFRLPNGREIELRVATLPVSSGDEDIVMRLLAAAEAIPLEAMHMTQRNLEMFQRLVHVPYGLILVVGPTGSGKTTTLHSALKVINTPERKIWTAEDPVEITQYGLRQVQVQPRIGFTFAAAMRSFLRADPDVIMVGEMRDLETARVGIEASLTGHLVFSTLHTNSAPETITRLLDMGMEPFTFADALLGVLAQRLARTLCAECKEPYHPSGEEFEVLRQAYGPEAFDALGHQYNADFVLYRPKGCRVCRETGYRGRIALHELLLGSKRMRRLIQRRARVTVIQHCAQQEGMTTLLQDGLLKVLMGLTDFTQVAAVVNAGGIDMDDDDDDDDE